jgi:hypothetical protein
MGILTMLVSFCVRFIDKNFYPFAGRSCGNISRGLGFAGLSDGIELSHVILFEGQK